MAKTRIAIAGCSGRMGKLLVQEISKTDDMCVAAGYCRPGSSLEGKDVGQVAGMNPIGVFVSSCSTKNLDGTDCMIDFSHVSAIEENLDAAMAKNVPVVIAITGLQENHTRIIHEASKQLPILYAANTSLGINILSRIAVEAARLSPHDVDIDIIEAHHHHKKDAPSGTALLLAENLKQAKTGSNPYNYYYHLPLSEQRPNNTIGISTIRNGSIPGDHRILFGFGEEIIELSHRAISPAIFAQGAIQAARWLVKNRSPGLYGMDNILGLSSSFC